MYKGWIRGGTWWDYFHEESLDRNSYRASYCTTTKMLLLWDANMITTEIDLGDFFTSFPNVTENELLMFELCHNLDMRELIIKLKEPKMDHPLKIIEQLRSTSSTNEKLNILREHKDNSLFKWVLRLTYDSSINFYIKTIKIKPCGPIYTLESILTTLEHTIATRKVTGNAAKKHLEDVVNCSSIENQEIVKLILRRDLKAGISDKSVLSVFPNLYTRFGYMRCSSKGSLPYPCFSEVKADGVFSRWFVRKDGVEVRSRQGTEFINIPDVVISEFRTLKESVYEGEMLILEDNVTLPREIGNGIINSCFIHGADNLKPNQKLHIVLWDILPEQDYWKGLCDIMRGSRLSMLKDQLLFTDYISPVSFKLVNSKQEEDEHYNHVVSLGCEGTVLKAPEGIWKDGTSKHQIKKKVEEVVELRCIGFNPANDGSKNEYTFGSILCRSECGKLEVSATGIKDDTRKEIWENREYYKGKVISIKSNGIMTPKKEGDKYSLFLPRYVEFRDHDKTEADTLERIKEQFNVD